VLVRISDLRIPGEPPAGAMRGPLESGVRVGNLAVDRRLPATFQGPFGQPHLSVPETPSALSGLSLLRL
jgi:hypothetical protein